MRTTTTTELGQLSNLENGLDLSGNAVEGPIPSEIGGLTNLKTGLDLSGNDVTGSIPSEVRGGGVVVL